MAQLHELLSSLGFACYDDYLRSDHWKSVQRSYHESDRPQECRCCKHPNYQLHHINYANLGAESLDDLVPLCRYCHKKVHKANKLYRLKLVDIDEAIKAVQQDEDYLPPTRKFTRFNSTKRERRYYRKQRKRGLRTLRSKALGEAGQVLIQCPKCHRRAWQDGIFCCFCGTESTVIKRND